MKNKIKKIANWLLDDTLNQIKNQDQKNEALKTRKQNILSKREDIKKEINNSKFKF